MVNIKNAKKKETANCPYCIANQGDGFANSFYIINVRKNIAIFVTDPRIC
jgi:hypothetical protein